MVVINLKISNLADDENYEEKNNIFHIGYQYDSISRNVSREREKEREIQFSNPYL